MGFVYDCMGRSDSADHYMVLAAISDLRSCTKEAVALAIVAQRLNASGDTPRAARYAPLSVRGAG